MSVWIGTSGWSYPHWGGGRFYPDGLPARRWLEFYAARFPAVEINCSFYGLPSAKSLEHWRESTPGDFRFAAKASRFFTHRKKLADPEIHLARFLERIAALGSKLSTLLFQLPPAWNFNPARLDALGRFLTRQTIVPGVRYAIEFRNPSWITFFEMLCEAFDGASREATQAVCAPPGVTRASPASCRFLDHSERCPGTRSQSTTAPAFSATAR